MKKAQAVRTRHPKATTRATILAKAYEMYLDRRLVHGDERLSHVLDELGYTTGAGYQIWPNQAAFRRELQIYVAENISYASPELVAEDVAEVIASSKSGEELALRVGDLYFAEMLRTEQFYITLRFFGMAHDRPEEITEALSDAYERSAWAVGPRLEAGMARIGLRVREPFTIDDLAAAVTALMEGYALRASVKNEQVTRKIKSEHGSYYAFSYAFLGVVNQFAEEIPS